MSKAALGPREIALRQMREDKFERLHKAAPAKSKKKPAKVSAVKSPS